MTDQRASRRIADALRFLQLADDEEIRAHAGLDERALASGSAKAAGTSPRTAEEAREWILRETTVEIAEGVRPPVEGARLLSRVFAGTDWSDEITPFIALASDWDDDIENRPAYEEDIREAARTAIANFERTGKGPRSAG